jgi:scyllo-inosamine-4-phosphate amidinotransferase 1
MVNCYNSFDQLKEIIVGDIDERILEFCDATQYDRFSFILKKTRQDLNAFQKNLESFDIKVHRPTFFDNLCVETPFWKSQGLKIPLTPRDNFLVVGNTIIETASWQKERFFEGFYYRDIFLDYFNRGANWISMPMPRHDGVDPDPMDSNHIPNRDPVIDAANVIKFGKDLFVSVAGSNNQLGLNWLERNLTDYRIHPVDRSIFSGHLDTHFSIIRPGLVYSYHSKNELPDYFKNWDLLSLNPEIDREKSLSQTFYDDKLQDDDFANTVLGVNILSINENTIMIDDHLENNLQLRRQLDQYRIEPIFVPITYSHFFNQGLTCITLDTVRDTAECIDYTK